MGIARAVSHPDKRKKLREVSGDGFSLADCWPFKQQIQQDEGELCHLERLFEKISP